MSTCSDTSTKSRSSRGSAILRSASTRALHLWGKVYTRSESWYSKDEHQPERELEKNGLSPGAAA